MAKNSPKFQSVMLVGNKERMVVAVGSLSHVMKAKRNYSKQMPDAYFNTQRIHA